jgi:hypothetical protein
MGYFCLHLKHLAHDSHPSKLKKIMVNAALAEELYLQSPLHFPGLGLYYNKAGVAETVLSHIFLFSGYYY